MSAKWFKDHVAYTMAKYGMSMCVLGMAEEFKADGIAVNALWPQTTIYTAAMAMLGGGEAVKAQCRRPEVMSDAAYTILTRDSKSATGNFYVDEAVLRSEGITDFDKYAYVKDAKILPDFFLEDLNSDELVQYIEKAGGKPAFRFTKDVPASSLAATFGMIEGTLNEELVKSIGGIFSFDLKDAGKWYMDLKNGSGSCGEGAAPTGEADCTMTLDAESFQKMFAGQLNATSAFMSGKLKIKGDLPLAMKLEKLMKKMQAKL